MGDNKIKDIFEKFRDRIWKTYKIRINTAERLKRNNSIVAFLSIYYSAILSAISIVNFYNGSKEMDLISIVLSVVVTILFLFFEGKNFKERHQNMKTNYNDLYLLYYEVEVYWANNDTYSEEQFEKFSERYVKLLNDVENHSDQDFWLYNIQNTSGNKPYFRYYSYKCLFWGFIIILFIIPTICFGISLNELTARML